MFSQFKNRMSGGRRRFTVTISSNEDNINIRTKMNSVGYAGQVNCDLNFINNSGVEIGSSSRTLPALDTGNFGAGCILTINNSGIIAGAGGTGGHGVNGNESPFINNADEVGFGGGDAIKISTSILIKINNTGTIFGGGGGGGGGGYNGY